MDMSAFGHELTSAGQLIFLVALVFFFKENHVPKRRVAHHTFWLCVGSIMVIAGTYIRFRHNGGG